VGSFRWHEWKQLHMPLNSGPSLVFPTRNFPKLSRSGSRFCHSSEVRNSTIRHRTERLLNFPSIIMYLTVYWQEFMFLAERLWLYYTKSCLANVFLYRLLRVCGFCVYVDLQWKRLGAVRSVPTPTLNLTRLHLHAMEFDCSTCIYFDVYLFSDRF